MPVQRYNLHNLPNQHRASISDHEGPNVATFTSRFFTNDDSHGVPSSEDASKPQSFHYPETSEEREIYRTMAGKKVTAHQWAVYDFVRTIPKGRVATYKDVASVAGGSARSVGSALRNNPFSPYVPCHRVIASSLFVGGFFGEWGKGHKTGTRYNDKIALLSQEGVHFDNSGHLLTVRGQVLWQK